MPPGFESHTAMSWRTEGGEMSDMKAFPSVIQYFPNDLNADEEKGMTLATTSRGRLSLL